jgi:methionyl-tRNA synthetase
LAQKGLSLSLPKYTFLPFKTEKMKTEKDSFQRYTITSALPYANGPVHIGHLAGVYVPADIYARYQRQQGREVLFIGGSDEHGVPITIKAKKEGKSPQEVVDQYHSLIKDSFARFGISFDVYSRTSAPIHHQTASDFFRKLYEEGAFLEKHTENYYDEEAGQFLADRYITGTCPHCDYEKAYGDQCESCGTSLNATDLIHPRSALSGAKPILKETLHWYLPLDQSEGWLREWILEKHKDDWKSNVYGQCKSWLDHGLQPRAVTRDLDWGVKVPVEGTDGKVLYVWFDAPIGYISAAREWAEEQRKDWQVWWKDEGSKLVHFIGKDNIVFHCIIFPAMLKAEGSYILPVNVPANEFLNLEGDKISTSKNWAVWLHEYLDDFAGKQDVLRYVLTANAPETKDNDFTWKDFQARNNNELLAVLGNFVNRTLVLTHKYFDGKVPSLAIQTPEDEAVLNALPAFPDRIARSLEAYRFREALSELMNLARLGNKYLTDSEPWKRIKTEPDRVKTILNISLQICANLSQLGAPFLPFSMEKIRAMLGLSLLDWASGGRTDLLEEGRELKPAELLFEKIEDRVIEAQVQKLKATREANQAEEAPILEESKAAVSYEDFMKMDIRTGIILAAEKVPKTKKLLKLRIDTGLDQRTVVSGIAEFFDPDTLPGQQVCILVNLEARKIKGIESQGMILMAEDARGKLVFIQPAEKMQAGAGVR